MPDVPALLPGLSGGDAVGLVGGGDVVNAFRVGGGGSFDVLLENSDRLIDPAGFKQPDHLGMLLEGAHGVERLHREVGAQGSDLADVGRVGSFEQRVAAGGEEHLMELRVVVEIAARVLLLL